jgi:probable rRNA maturation factor
MIVEVEDRQTLAVDRAALTALARTVLREEGLPERAEVTIHLVADEEMAGRNLASLGRGGPTDVLSFPLQPPAPEGGFPAGGPPLLLGDVLIAPAYVERQASSLGVAFEDEVALMLVHGLLHLLGYDHQDDREAERMEGRERELLALAGVEHR